MEKYSYYELLVIRNSIQEALNGELNKKERYAFLKNLTKVKQELETLEQDLKDEVEEIKEYRQKLFEVYLECGAKSKQLPNGAVQITDTEDVDLKKFKKEEAKLIEEYKNALNKQDKIDKENHEKKQQKTAEIDWYYISFDDVDSSDDKVINENTFHLIKE